MMICEDALILKEDGLCVNRGPMCLNLKPFTTMMCEPEDTFYRLNKAMPKSRHLCVGFYLEGSTLAYSTFDFLQTGGEELNSRCRGRTPGCPDAPSEPPESPAPPCFFCWNGWISYLFFYLCGFSCPELKMIEWSEIMDPSSKQPRDDCPPLILRLPTITTCVTESRKTSTIRRANPNSCSE